MGEKIVSYKCDECGAATKNIRQFGLPNDKVYTVHKCDGCVKRADMEYSWQRINETLEENRLICPYCDYEFDDYDAYAFEEGTHDEVECESCGKKFDLEVDYRVTFSTKRSVVEMPDDYDPDED